MVEVWFRMGPSGAEAVQIWFRFGPSGAEAVHIWFRFGSDWARRGQRRFRFGSDLVQIWPVGGRGGSDWVQIWFRFGPSGAEVVQIWFRFGLAGGKGGSDLVQIWFGLNASGVKAVQIWFRFGSDWVRRGRRRFRFGSGLVQIGPVGGSRGGSDLVQMWFRFGPSGAESVQILVPVRLGWGPTVSKKRYTLDRRCVPQHCFDETFCLVVGFSVGVTHRPWTWPTHVAIAYVGSEFSPSLDTPATGEDALALPTHRPRAWRSQAVLPARPCHVMAWPPPRGRPSWWNRES